jgi:regulator of replication initiation timing
MFKRWVAKIVREEFDKPWSYTSRWKYAFMTVDNKTERLTSAMDSVWDRLREIESSIGNLNELCGNMKSNLDSLAENNMNLEKRIDSFEHFLGSISRECLCNQRRLFHIERLLVTKSVASDKEVYAGCQGIHDGNINLFTQVKEKEIE